MYLLSMYCVLEIEKKKRTLFSFSDNGIEQSDLYKNEAQSQNSWAAGTAWFTNDTASVVSPYSVLNVIEHIPVCLSAWPLLECFLSSQIMPKMNSVRNHQDDCLQTEWVLLSSLHLHQVHTHWDGFDLYLIVRENKPVQWNL